MRFKIMKKSFDKANKKSAEGAEHFMQTAPEKVTNHVEIDSYLNDFKCLKPKVRRIKNK